MKPDYTSEEYSRRDPLAFNQMILFFENTFAVHKDDFHNVLNLAKKIREGLARMNPFIQQANQSVCPRCKDVCCISKHGYYTHEDLIYLFALGLQPPHVSFGRHDSAPCQYLLENGCSIERMRRPSHCNWYFCDSLLDYMEPQPAYRDFDETLRDVAELWIEMVEEFRRIS
jgi:hypothetical protein